VLLSCLFAILLRHEKATAAYNYRPIHYIRCTPFYIVILSEPKLHFVDVITCFTFARSTDSPHYRYICFYCIHVIWRDRVTFGLVHTLARVIITVTTVILVVTIWQEQMRGPGTSLHCYWFVSPTVTGPVSNNWIVTGLGHFQPAWTYLWPH